MHRIDFSNNNSLGGRMNGEKVRKEIVQNINETVAVDLKNVIVISNSFADEAFGKLLTVEKIEFAMLMNKLKFYNTTDLVKKMIIKALNERKKEI